MPKARINVGALYAALDAEREARDLSWRQLAHDVGVSPSTLSRMGQGSGPAADAFAALVDWLGVPAEEFIDRGGDSTSREVPDLVAQVAPLLRARKDLTEADVEYLEQLIGAAVRRFRADRDQGG